MLVDFLNKNKINNQTVSVPLPLDKVVVIVLGGGEGRRLDPLTKSRCKPAVSFGGRYSLIDVPLSHSLGSGLNRIYVIGQYLANTLQQHLVHSYLHYGVANNTIQLLVPEERDHQQIWYKGTADAVRQNLRYFHEIPAEYFLILSGDQLYNINFQDMIRYGIEKNAGMVIATHPVTEKNARRMGVMKVEPESGRLTDFYEKPQEEAILQQFRTDPASFGIQGSVPPGHSYLGSMGIYLFKRESLFQLLAEDDRDDFGKHLILTQMKKRDVFSYLYDGYWEDIGTVESYYKANLALAHAHIPKEGLHCYDDSTIIITKSYNLPGARISDCKINDALICEGSIIEGKEITNSIVGIRSVIEQGTIVRDSILMGNEFYKQSPLEMGGCTIEPKIGKNSVIYKAIIDENVTIGSGVKLINQQNYQDYSSPDGRLFVRDGIIVVPKGSVFPDNFSF